MNDSNKNFRIKTNNKDKVLNVNLTRDIDFLEILSLKIDTSSAYKLTSSNYGVIVGRVLANEGFGIPNAKISVFIPIEENDKLRSEITNLYRFSNVSDSDRNGVRYNLLPAYSNDNCYQIVGTFPEKRLVLDDETVLEVYEKYFKYTTVTNDSGDYMIFGVPVGQQSIHVDLDLSDIGILSQKPRDLIYQGYNINQFESANLFKKSTNLDNLSQIVKQDQSVYVYPFWGDTNSTQVAITRCDVAVAYKFQPTCVFMGSIITDSGESFISPKGRIKETAGKNSKLISAGGTIEMIRKTTDGLVEQVYVQGNQLIDDDGVFCYQVPMNLDYVTTDEKGNIVPTDNPKKGIPTRTKVRFRFSISGDGDEKGVRAKYLVPNNPKLQRNGMIPKLTSDKIDKEVLNDETGLMEMQKVSRYDIRYINDKGEKVTVENLGQVFNPIFYNYNKLISGLFRHGMPIEYAVSTIKSLNFDNESINSWKNGVVRILKSYLKDGEVKGEVCPECGAKIVRENGCKRCGANCGWSACS